MVCLGMLLANAGNEHIPTFSLPNFLTTSSAANPVKCPVFEDPLLHATSPILGALIILPQFFFMDSSLNYLSLFL
jgi:VIT1/CCC1 family predicted Fe2+/Mn2+ transporter